VNPQSTGERLPYFDTLRTLMVVLVLVFHSAVSYGTPAGFWPFHDSPPSEAIDVLLLLLDTFMMSVLFFVSGYFALSSLRRKGSGRFLWSKLARLGGPWLAVTALVLPLLDYAAYVTHVSAAGEAVRKYGLHWWLGVRKFAEFTFCRMRMSSYLDLTEHFYQRYLWYLSLLLLLCFLFWLSRHVTSRLMKNRMPSTAPRPRRVVRALLVVGAVNVAGYALTKLLWSSPNDPFDMVWFSAGNLVQFQTAKLAFYVSFFALGAFANARHWLDEDRHLGRPWLWGVACLGLMGATVMVMRQISLASEPTVLLQAASLVLYPLWTTVFVLFFVAFAVKRWRRASAFSRALSANSYGMYLAHYPFAVLLPLLLGRWVGGPALAKFAMVACVTLFVSYTLSRYVLRSHARWLLAALILVNAAWHSSASVEVHVECQVLQLTTAST